MSGGRLAIDQSRVGQPPVDRVFGPERRDAEGQGLHLYPVHDHEREQQLIPDPKDVVDRDSGEGAASDRQHDAPEGSELCAAIDEGRLEDLLWKIEEEGAQENGREGKPERDVDEDESEVVAEEAEVGHEEVQRQQKCMCGDRDEHEQQAEVGARPECMEPRQPISGHGREEQQDRHRDAQSTIRLLRK